MIEKLYDNHCDSEAYVLEEPEPIINLNDFAATRRNPDPINSRANSILADIISKRIQTKALPLALRKRLMYEQSLQH